MNKKIPILWAALWAACAGLSAIPGPTGALQGLMVVLTLAFFIPPAWLLYRAIPRRELAVIRALRNASLGTLALTLVLLVVNLLSADASAAAGRVLYVLLVLVSVPMVCGQAWALGLFLWACLLMVCSSQLKKK